MSAASAPSFGLSGRTRVIIGLAGVYALYAVLLNSVGTVILQALSTLHVEKGQASILEGCKDLSIAASSFALASFLPRLGYKRALVGGLLAVAAACVAMPLLPGFATTAALFLVVGVSFGVAKVAVYGSVGLIAADPRRHAGVISFVEGVFMVGVLSGYWLFSAFFRPDAPLGWLNVYWVLATAAIGLALFWALTPLDESALVTEPESFVRSLVGMLSLMRRQVVIVFLVCAFLYVLVEQALGSWMPTFNHETLRLSPTLAVQFASLYALALCIGRLVGGLVLPRLPRFATLIACVVAILPLLALVAFATPSEGGPLQSWTTIPPLALALPAVGLVMGPIYPTVNSTVLSALPVTRQAAMTGLIVIFSALGGTFGSFLTGQVFAHAGGRAAVAGVLVPTVLLAGAVLILGQVLKRPQAET